jgi:hypothetical protein
MVRDELPPGAALRALGEHLLRDIAIELLSPQETGHLNEAIPWNSGPSDG